ncbi:MAG: cell envelope integrity protein TolA [Deltaproteobacteria bacterium]|nr:cell envelope integrity protein TolA [Deltaproteobacteria bacterium]
MSGRTASHSYSYLRPRQRGFWWVFLVSTALHAVAIATYALGTAQRRPTIDFSTDVIQTKLVRLGRPRDPKLLPRIVKTPAAAPTEKLISTKDDGEKEKLDEKRDEKMREALRKIEEEERRRQALQRIAERVGKDETEGNPEGSAFGSDDQAGPMSLAQAYFARLQEHIRSNYSLPSILSDAERRRLQATITVYIAADGRISRHEVEQSSGNDVFDQALEAAILRASPVPEPPVFLRDTVAKGVSLRFKP